MNMGQLYQLGTTPIGKTFEIIKKAFDENEIKLLEEMSNEEKLRDLEASFYANASVIQGGPGPGPSDRIFSNFANN